MKQAILPENLEAATLASMSVGESAYTLPWGMWVDGDRRCWLHPGYPAEPKPGGTVRMRVELQPNGFHVWTPPGETWNPQPEPSYASSAATEYLAVVELHQC